ncbi:unnamed protein product [Rotaria magnacalcarata]|uniref:HMG box domain-containing protein n=1 Tax=Rotaria magnacalcarata TaxID=392030 RepID=A0A819AIK9_9BILA|nr:unnamed protein product [Rotaria magnacalcarata]CAF2118660.1 unnamed protein product [Rotaria magnacalcarata]CAF3750589.1 unnamed protein product [Rotaria magnacalcarata]CAF3785192.1 unnamed protein product [Rotaria magnacalcarata]
MMSTSIDPHNTSHNSNGRSLRIVSTNRLFTKVRTEQPPDSILPSIMDATSLFSDHNLHVFPKDEPILDETTIITSSSPPPSFVDFHQTLSTSASSPSSPTSFSPLQHDHSYGVSTNSSSLLPSPSSPDPLTSSDLTSQNSRSSVVATWPQINCRALRPDDYHMLLELLSSNTNADSPPIFFGSALIDPSTSTPYSDATRTQPKKRARPGHVKRPMNAFMVFSQIERRKMIQLAPHLPNADISKCCGAKWKRMSLRERQPYMEESERLKQLHARQYPAYKYQPRKRGKTNQPTNAVPNSPSISGSSSSSSSPSATVPSLNRMTTIPSHMSTVSKEQFQTLPPPSLLQSSSSAASSSSTSNPNDPISVLVATLFDQKLAMFASNLQQFNIDHLQYQFTPPNTQLYPSPTPLPFDPVAFLAKQQQHRVV